MYLEGDRTASECIDKESTFRKAFKRFKNDFEATGSTEVIDFDYSDSLKDWTEIRLDSVEAYDYSVFSDIFVKNPKFWNVRKFAKKPGLIVARNIFEPMGHYVWAKRCLDTYPLAPNKINLISDFNRRDFNSFSKKLRWITMGYHHNWDTKQYSEQSRSPMPQEIQDLCSLVAKVIFDLPNFRAEAAIVNFYHKNSTLAGHVDQSERTYDAPLFSFSFGQSAIFLLGGIRMDDPDWPMAIKLKSGDLLIMYDQMRLAYHAIPKILSGEYTCEDGQFETDRRVVDYLNSNRININVRQVNGD